MQILQKRVKVIVDLLERGASSVEITDSGIKVSRKEYEQIVGYARPQQNQIVQLINNISTNINIDSRTIINQVLDNIRNNESSPERVSEAEKKLGLLLKEIQKKKPKWHNVKGVLKWALDFEKDVFIQLIPVALQIAKNL